MQTKSSAGHGGDGEVGRSLWGPKEESLKGRQLTFLRFWGKRGKSKIRGVPENMIW